MSQVIVYRRADGGTSVMHPASRHRLSDLAAAPWLAWLAAKGIWSENEATLDAKWIEYVRDKDVPADALDVAIIEASAIPTDRTFRDALNPDCSHDMAKARAIWTDKMRAARAPKLAALDIAWQRAAEVGDVAAQAAIVAQKQALRDVTADPAITSCMTCDALKAVWPAALRD